MRAITFWCDSELYEWLEEQQYINNMKLSPTIRELLERIRYEQSIKMQLER